MGANFKSTLFDSNGKFLANQSITLRDLDGTVFHVTKSGIDGSVEIARSLLKNQFEIQYNGSLIGQEIHGFPSGANVFFIFQ